jgi:hypothetical protein
VSDPNYVHFVVSWRERGFLREWDGVDHAQIVLHPSEPLEHSMDSLTEIRRPLGDPDLATPRRVKTGMSVPHERVKPSATRAVLFRTRKKAYPAMYEITEIKVSRKPPLLDTITDYFFKSSTANPDVWMPKAAAVKYVDENPDVVKVSGGGATVSVEVVDHRPEPYLRTKGDGTISDNLLQQHIAN